MEKIIDAADVDLVVIGTPIDLRQRDRHPQAGRARALRPRGAAGSPTLADILRPVPRDSVERVVVALGGNALLRRGAEDTYDEMYRAARRRRRADRRHRGRRVGGRRSPTATARRWAGSCCSRRPPPTSVQPDAARRVRRREPGADRLPAAGHDRRRLLRARHGATGRDGAHAHAGAGATTRRSPTRRSSWGRTYEEPEARRLEARARLHDEGRPARRMAPGRARARSRTRSSRRP